MYLHDAMVEVLRKRSGRRAHRADIADAINRGRLYVRRDGAPLHANQISARASKYPDHFRGFGGGVIGLR
jgi:hypothetical protein